MLTLENVDITTVVSTLGIYAAIVISPGPNFTLISRLSLQGRRGAAYGGTVGFTIAATFYALLAMIGMAALLSEIGWLARAVQIGGGSYLIYLGITAWRSSPKNSGTGDDDGSVTPAFQSDFFDGLKLGLLVELSNPKGIAFFVGLYAAAVPLDASIETRMLILVGGGFLELAWYGLVAVFLSQSTPRAIYRRFSQWIERVIGTVLIVFGAKLVLDR